MAHISITIEHPSVVPPTLAPQSGFDGATSQPSAVGDSEALGYSRMPIARWDVPQGASFSSTFKVGIPAWHLSVALGPIDRIDFSVNGGAWVPISTMSVNSSTANTSDFGVSTDAAGKGTYSGGIVEYWAALNPALFGNNATVTVRAVVYPVNGVPRVMDDLVLKANPTGGAVVWLDAGTSGTEAGTEANPFKTFTDALSGIYSAGASGGTIKCLAGSYTIPNKGLNTAGMTDYTTVEAAPGVDAADVIFDVSGGYSDLGWKLIHWKNVTLGPTGGAELVYTQSGGRWWIERCNMQGPGPRTGYQFFNTAGLGEVYITDTSISGATTGVRNAVLVRNVAIDDIESDVFQGCPIIINPSSTFPKSVYTGVNLTVDGSDNTLVTPDGYTPDSHDVQTTLDTDHWPQVRVDSGTGFTPGIYWVQAIVGGKWQLDRSPAATGTSGGAWTFFTGAHSDTQQWLSPADNVVFYGISAEIGDASGISAGSSNISGPLDNIAIVNTVITGHPVNSTGFYCGAVCTNFFVLNSVFPGLCYWYNPGGLPNGFVPHDVVLDSSTFGQNMASTGVTIR